MRPPLIDKSSPVPKHKHICKLYYMMNITQETVLHHGNKVMIPFAGKKRRK